MRKLVSAFAINKDADQTAYPRTLTSTFAVYCLNTIISLVLVFQASCQSLLLRGLTFVLHRMKPRKQFFSCLGSSIISTFDAYNDCAIIKLSQTYVLGAVSWVMLAEALF